MKCENCNQEIIAFVCYGSYCLQCRHCKALGPITSFIALRDGLSGSFEIIEMDKELNPIYTLAKGNIVDYLQLIADEAGKGKRLWLKKYK